MREALQDLDPVLLRIKLGAVSALAQTLRRYTSLNHLAQAARAVLKNPTQINQMLIDLSRVDFNNVQVRVIEKVLLRYSFFYSCTMFPYAFILNEMWTRQIYWTWLYLTILFVCLVFIWAFLPLDAMHLFLLNDESLENGYDFIYHLLPLNKKSYLRYDSDIGEEKDKVGAF